MAHDVFISYSSKDKAIADGICATLEGRRIRCWIAPRDVLPGVPYGEALIDALSASRLLVLVFSSHSNVSPQVAREVERAVSKGMPIIPFRIEAVPMSKLMEYFISSPHWLDALSRPVEKHLAYLADTVTLLLTRLDGDPAAPHDEDPFPSAVPKTRRASQRRPSHPARQRGHVATRPASRTWLVAGVAAALLAAGVGVWLHTRTPGSAGGESQRSNDPSVVVGSTPSSFGKAETAKPDDPGPVKGRQEPVEPLGEAAGPKLADKPPALPGAHGPRLVRVDETGLAEKIKVVFVDNSFQEWLDAGKTEYRTEFPSGTDRLAIVVALTVTPPDGAQLDYEILNGSGEVKLRDFVNETRRNRVDGAFLAEFRFRPQGAAFPDGPYQAKLKIDGKMVALLNWSVGGVVPPAR